MKLFLLDAYAIIYRAYYAFIKNPRINSRGINTSAVWGFCNTLLEVIEKEQPTHLGVAFDPHGPTFRSEAYPQYKAQRQETPEDIRAAVPVIKDILAAFNIPVLQADGFEADDVIGTLATQAGQRQIDTYMLTPDKDYGQLVRDHVYIYRPRHGGGYEVMDSAAVCQKYGIATTAQVIDLLALMGDTADNFPGCPGVGEKTAAKLIAEFGSVDQLLASTALLKGKLRERIETHADDIRMSKFLATIRTDVPVALNMEALQRQSLNEEALLNIFNDLEFKTMAQRILNKNKPAARKASAEPSLFDQPADHAAEAPLFAHHETIHTTPHRYHLVDHEDDARRLCQQLMGHTAVSIDTETTSTHAIDAQLVGMSFAVAEHEAWYVPVPADEAAARQVTEIFRPLFEDEHITKIGQNIKYDIIVLARYDIHVSGPLWDTMIAHYLLQPEVHHNMDYLAEAFLGYQTIHIDELIGARGRNQRSMRDMDPALVCDYAAEDADITLQLKNHLEPKLREAGADQLFHEMEMPLIPVLADMELNGVRIDTHALTETADIFNSRLATLEQRIYQLAGEQFNIASPRQVGDILFGKLKLLDKAKKTRRGQFVTNEETLQSLRGKHEIVGAILDHRGLKKLLNTYVDALPKLVNPRTGHIHTSFNQAVTATGRLSSSDPNLQNIPVRGQDGKEIRRCFVPEPGSLFLSADYSQIELRVMAHLSGDAHMMQVFREGKDLHAATAATIYKKDIADVSRDERNKSKRANFGIIYGITSFGLATRLEIDRHEAQQLIDGFFDTFPQVHTYMEEAKEHVRHTGYAETLFHRRRYLPDIASHNATVRGFAERNAINAPIQGSAADIIKVAMVRIHRRMKSEGLRSKMILQVHDELNFSVLPEERERMERLVVEEMQNAFALNVPLVVDAGWGTNWLEAH